MDYRKYSSLPDTPEYWESLATRIEAATTATSDDGRSWLRAASIVAFLSAAAAAAVFLVAPTPKQTSLADALAPADPVAALFLESK